MAPGSRSGRVRVRRVSDGSIIGERVVLGTSFAQRFRGLMGRASLAADEGLFLPTSSIHMLFMRFAIDALFVGRPDADGARRVISAREHLPPWRGIVLPVRGAAGVVELRAGTLGRVGVRAGDVVTFESA